MEGSIVEKHLRGEASDDETARLEQDLKGWRDALHAIVQGCEDEIRSARARYQRYGNAPARGVFERTRDEALERKQAAIGILREVKDRIAQANRDTNPGYHQQMLDELRLIREAIERQERRAAKAG